MAIKKEYCKEEFWRIEELMEYLEDIKESIIMSPTVFKEDNKYIVLVYRRVEYYD